MRTQFGKLIRDSGVCVLCGNNAATTKEHIPPQSLFIKAPNEYLLVPACSRCNQGTKLQDEHLRQVMSGASHTEEGLAVWRSKVRPKLKAFPKTRAGLARNLVRGAINVPGIGTAPVPVLLVEASRLRVSIRKLVWGLHWFHSGKILPKDESLGLQPLNIAEVGAHFDDPEREKVFKLTKSGIYTNQEVMRTFYYTCAITPENSLWYFFFYRQNVVIAYTGTAAEIVNEPSNNRMNPPAGGKPGATARPRSPAAGYAESWATEIPVGFHDVTMEVSDVKNAPRSLLFPHDLGPSRGLW